MSTSNNNPKGILLILIGMAIFSIQDALIKFIFEDEFFRCKNRLSHSLDLNSKQLVSGR